MNRGTRNSSVNFAVKFVMTIAAVTCATLTIPTLAGESNDQLTGLVLHAGLTFQQEVDSPICDKPAQINLYGAPRDATVADYLSWYKAQLKNFHYAHSVYMQRVQDSFLSPDGLKIVAVTGKPNGPGVYAMNYIKLSAAITTKQMDAFSPNNSSCK